MPKISFKEQGCGASTGLKVDYNNFRTLEEIKQAVHTYGNPVRVKSNKVLPIFINKEEIYKQDCTFLWDKISHCFVVTILWTQKKAYVADATNIYAANSEIRSKLCSKLEGIEITNQVYISDSGADHCSSTAVIIVFQHRRFYATSYWPKVIEAPKSLKNQLISILHKKLSQPTQPSRNIKAINLAKERKCIKCGKKMSNHQKLVAHTRFCRAEAA